MRTLRKSMVAIFAVLVVASPTGGSAGPGDSAGFALDPCPWPDLVLHAPLARPPVSDSGFGCPIDRTSI
jgi:hypothetical protein